VAGWSSGGDVQGGEEGDFAGVRNLKDRPPCPSKAGTARRAGARRRLARDSHRHVPLLLGYSALALDLGHRGSRLTPCATRR
jgi:hypothetical protein